MAVDSAGGDSGLRAEVLDEGGERLELARGRASVLEIADEADADAVVVEEVAWPLHAEVAPRAGLAVGAGFLEAPALSDEDLSVGVVDAIADDEVITEAAVPAAGIAVVVVHACRRVHFAGGVVHNDHLPAAARDGCAGPDRGWVEAARNRGSPRGRLARLRQWVCRGHRPTSAGREDRFTQIRACRLGRFAAGQERGERRSRAHAQCNPLHA